MCSCGGAPPALSVRMEPPKAAGACPPVSPLQRSVYWRLALVFILNPLLFFLDIFTAAIIADTCRPGNGSGPDAAARGNQSGRAEGGDQAVSHDLLASWLGGSFWGVFLSLL